MAAGLNGDRVAVDLHVDVGHRDEFDVGGGEFGLAGSTFDRDGGGLNSAHGVIGQHDACELMFHAVEFAPRGVELAEAGLEPVGLVAVRHPLRHAAGHVDTGLRCLNRAARPFRRDLGRLLDLSGGGELLEGFGCCGLERGYRSRALVDVGTQPSPLSECGDGCGVGGVCGRGHYLRLLELLRQGVYGLGRETGLSEAFRRFGPLFGEP